MIRPNWSNNDFIDLCKIAGLSGLIMIYDLQKIADLTGLIINL